MIVDIVIVKTALRQTVGHGPHIVRIGIAVGLHRLRGIQYGYVAHMLALAQKIAEPFAILEPLLHVGPIWHSEVEARRRPLPPTAVG